MRRVDKGKAFMRHVLNIIKTVTVYSCCTTNVRKIKESQILKNRKKIYAKGMPWVDIDQKKKQTQTKQKQRNSHKTSEECLKKHC